DAGRFFRLGGEADREPGDARHQHASRHSRLSLTQALLAPRLFLSTHAHKGGGSHAFEMRGDPMVRVGLDRQRPQRSAEALFTEGCRSPSGLTNMEILKNKF
ncbi:MAG: hypothetical protein JF570_13070, partial [Caulobacter sp.]|nr:hypothetical protein [Caulobacter sp.]